MIKCRIGLISKPVNNSFLGYINLGEVYINKNVENLYSIHTNTQYLTSFIGLIKNNSIIDNIEEIYRVQERYKLTRKLYYSGNLSGKLIFSKPLLYDISCMVPLFSDKIMYIRIRLYDFLKYRVFIVMPICDPIICGKALKSCIDMNNDRKSLFYTMGGKFGNNKKSSCILSKRYLMENHSIDFYDIFVISLIILKK